MDEVNEILRWPASRWSECTHRFDLIAADVTGDLAYVVGFEHIAHSVVGVAVEPYTLRVTHIFRREHGEWGVAHRHADYVPADQTAPRWGRARPAVCPRSVRGSTTR